MSDALPEAAQQALQAFADAGSWEARARLLMSWGERLETLTDTERSDANQVDGCESRLWLVAEQQQAHWYFRGTSEARLLRGLLAVLLARVNGLTAEQLQRLDAVAWFAQLGLARQLSPSRASGMNAVLGRMRQLTTT